MVGRLVHYIEIRLCRQHFGYCGSFDFSSGEFFHFLAEVCQPEICQVLLHPPFVFPEMFLVKMRCEPCAVGHYLVKDAFFRIEVVFLLKKCYPYVFQEDYFPAGVRLVFSGKDFQERCLACAVWGYQGNLVPFVDIESDMFEKDFRPV